jgi:hypothetical protein
MEMPPAASRSAAAPAVNIKVALDGGNPAPHLTTVVQPHERQIVVEG